MRTYCWLAVPVVLGVTVAFALAADTAPNETGITWKKTAIEKIFRSEGSAVADVNRDGKMDVLNGEMWYEAPDWKPHEIRKPGDYKDGAAGYSISFACWADDVNADGWPDLIVVGFPGAPCHWFENPRGASSHWKPHEIWHSACNETPLYADLFGNGKRVLLMGWQPKGKDNEGQMAWFTPGEDPTKPWKMHPVSEVSVPAKPIEKGKKDAVGDPKAMQVPGTQRFYHGLGIGDVNGDGRNDVLVADGWWEQPEKLDGNAWKFHPAPLGPACADMYATDLDGDGKADVVSSSAHNYGIWAHLQKPGTGGNPAFLRTDLFPKLFSQSHALHFVDINGDGLKDLVTGKRWWAHGPKGDADPMAPAVVYWFEAKKGSGGIVTFTPHRIDDDSGIGTQFTVADVNGDKLLDVVTSNKKGTYLFEQVRARK